MNEYQQTLLSVRNSYRLLHDYQRLILDSCDFIRTQLQLDYQGGYYKFSSAPVKNGGGDLKKWAWDWLGMIAYDMHCKKQDPEGDILLSMLHLADTNAFKAPRESRPDSKSFDSAVSGKSLIIFLYYLKPTGESWGDWNLSMLENDDERIVFTEKCEALQSFQHNAIGVFSVEVEEIFTEAGAKEVVKKLGEYFPKLKLTEA